MIKRNNLKLTQASSNYHDEFFTRLVDVEHELNHYTQYFKNKTIYCNCDKPGKSAFWQYFYQNFHKFQLKKLIASYYENNKPTYIYIYNGKYVNKIANSNGSFSSLSEIKYLKQADLIVTNPPFSQFASYFNYIRMFNKKFIVWGNLNAITYRDIFPLIIKKQLHLGYMVNQACYFSVPQEYKANEKITQKIGDGKRYARVPAITVFTNLPVKAIGKKTGVKKFDLAKYPVYDNFPAFNVSRIADLPKKEAITICLPVERLTEFKNYYQHDLTILKNQKQNVYVKIEHPVYGVPITYLYQCRRKTNYERKIIGIFNHGTDSKYDLAKPFINGKQIFKRLAVR